MDADGETGRQPERDVGPRGQPAGRTGGRRQQAQQEQCSDRLRRERSSRSDQGEECHIERSHPHTSRCRDGGVEGREQQRPADDDDQTDERERKQRGGDRVSEAETEDRAEEHADSRRAGLCGVCGRCVDRECEHAEPEHPGEDRADHDVVRAASIPQQSQGDPDCDGRAEQSPPSGRCRSRGRPVRR